MAQEYVTRLYVRNLMRARLDEAARARIARDALRARPAARGPRATLAAALYALAARLDDCCRPAQTGYPQPSRTR